MVIGETLSLNRQGQQSVCNRRLIVILGNKMGVKLHGLMTQPKPNGNTCNQFF